MVVVPYRPGLLDEQLAKHGVAPPESPGRAADSALLERIFNAAGWSFTSVQRGNIYEARFSSRDDRWPPISDLTLHDGEFLGFRLGPLPGPFHVAREVARACGPQVAVEASSGYTCVVTSAMSYAEFYLSMTGSAAPADELDREWSPPRS